MLKKLILFLTVFVATTYAQAQAVTINDSAGWLESAFVKWKPVSGAQSYNVYYSGNGLTDKKIDSPLIRSYGSYFRADVVGLKAGSYTLKVAAVVSGTEGPKTVTGTLIVKAHDRTGFAFANGRVPGAYNADGTPKSGAVILYVTEKTKNTVSLTVTGASTNPCVGLQPILDGFKKGKDTRPLIIRVVGQVTDLSNMLAGDIVIENSNNAASFITLEGIGEDAVADGWGIRIKNASNIEVRNIATMNCNSGEGDNVGLQQGNDYVWVHNSDFFYGDAGGDADQVKGDGALDSKKSTYITFSYNHFWDNGKSNLVGLSEGTTAGLYITFHHNWYDHSDSRHPRVRYYSAHVYNNYYDGNAKYGAGSTLGSSVFMEGNYFRNCKYPMLTSMQGSDIWDESKGANNAGEMATFSNEAGGSIKALNNFMTGEKRFVPYGASGYPNSTVDFDAFVVTSKSQTMPSSVKSSSGGNTYNNFDNNSSVMYNYTAETPQSAMATVMQYAGRVGGGDFKWAFNNSVDDASYAVNAPLKNALTNYKTKLVYIQGEGVVIAPNPDPIVSLTANAGDASVVLNWTIANGTATAYEVYRGTDANTGNRVKLSNLTATATTYTDATAVNGTMYYYWVKANGSIDSNAVTATPKAVVVPPTGGIVLTATAGNSSVSLNWNITNLTITSQEVYRDTDSNPSGRTKLSGVSTSTRTYTDATAVNGTTYFYWIKANASVNSNPAEATPAGTVVVSTTRIEDTDAGTISYDGAIKAYPNADNGKTINLSNGANNQIIWNYSAPASGSYQLTFRYTRKASMNSSVTILVNGISQTLSLSETAGSEFTTSAITASLNSGTNTIILKSNTSGESADIDWIEIKKSGTTSKKSLKEKETSAVEVSVYPNPTTDFITVQLPNDSESSLVVYNATGQLIFSKENTKGDQTLDLTKSGNGIHIVRILNGGNEVVKKIIKK